MLVVALFAPTNGTACLCLFRLDISFVCGKDAVTQRRLTHLAHHSHARITGSMAIPLQGWNLRRFPSRRPWHRRRLQATHEAGAHPAPRYRDQHRAHALGPIHQLGADQGRPRRKVGVCGWGWGGCGGSRTGGCGTSSGGGRGGSTPSRGGACCGVKTLILAITRATAG